MLLRPVSLMIFLVSMIYVILNIYSSLSVHPLFFRMASDEGSAAVQYLSTIRSLPSFKDLYRWYNSKSNQDLYESVYRDSIVRSERIAQLEQVLTKNPSAPTVLAALADLYSLQGDDMKAQLYYYRAKQVDPGLQ